MYNNLPRFGHSRGRPQGGNTKNTN